MKQIYSCVSVRNINGAGHCYFKNGMVHPDRILEEHDFIYIVDGSWEICQNGDIYTANRDDVIILHAGEHHYGLKPCEPNTRTMYFHVYYDKHDGFGDAPGADGKAAIELDTLIHCRNNTSVAPLFRDIIFTSLSDGHNKEVRNTSLFNLLLCELHGSLSIQAGERVDYAENVINTIQQNPNRFFSAKELSEGLYICERSLMNNFRKKYGKSIYRYQLDLKLEIVRNFLLDYPDVKLYEIAANYGFYDEFHLSKLFKKKFGVSPNVYRKFEQPGVKAT